MATSVLAGCKGRPPLAEVGGGEGRIGRIGHDATSLALNNGKLMIYILLLTTLMYSEC